MRSSAFEIPDSSLPFGIRTTEVMAELRHLPGLSELWARTMGESDVCIAILDGPVDLTHPSLTKADISQVQLPDIARSERHSADHGTHVASVIFGDVDTGVPGIAPGCRGVAISIFEQAPDGSLAPCSQERLAAAIDLAVACGAKVINISAGQLSADGAATAALEAAVERASRRALIVAAAGNDGCNCLHVPGALPSVLAVGAMDARGEPMAFSNWGDRYREQGLLAPGENILGAVAGDGVRPRSGTSFSAPIVAGVAGLLLSLARQRGQDLAPQQLRELLLHTTDGCISGQAKDCTKHLVGKLNLLSLLQQVDQWGASTVNSPTHIQHFQNRAPERFAGITASNVETSCASAATTAPSGCGCGCGPKQLAYVIGQLGYDFESDARRDSIQQALISPTAITKEVDVANPYDLLRHLRGYEEIKLTVKAGRIKNVAVNNIDGVDRIEFETEIPPFAGPLPDPNALDAADDDGRQIAIFGLRDRIGSTGPFIDSMLNATQASTRIKVKAPNKFYLVDFPPQAGQEFLPFCAEWVLPIACETTRTHEQQMDDSTGVAWTLMRGNNVLYVVRPTDSFSETAYDKLTQFLMNHYGWSDAALNLYYFEHCAEIKPWLAPWNPCLNPKTDTTKDAVFAPSLYVEVSERVAIPGVVKGAVTLRSQLTIPVLQPAMRGASEWSSETLFKAIVEIMLAQGLTVGSTFKRKIRDLLDRLDEEVRNPGLCPRDRALNFASTQHVEVLSLVKKDLDGPFELDDVLDPEASMHCRAGSDCWDVEVSFFNPGNVQTAPILVRQSVDVSDVLPVIIDRPKRFRRRGDNQ